MGAPDGAPSTLRYTANARALTANCRHQTALLTPAVPGSLLGVPVPGLTTSPDTAAWLLARLAWLPVIAAALLGLARLAHRFEAPWTGIRGPAGRRSRCRPEPSRATP